MGRTKKPVAALKCHFCSQPFSSSRAARFCCEEHRKAFARLMAIQGAILAPLIKAWTATRHAPAGSNEAIVCGYARREITSIASILNEEDASAGVASAIEYVNALMDAGFRYIDRKKNFKKGAVQ